MVSVLKSDIQSEHNSNTLVPFSQSKIWSFSNTYYQAKGIETFDKNVTPNLISSNYSVGQKYAKLIASAVLDLKNNKLLTEGSHIRIIELGSGHGRLSEHLINYLKGFVPLFQDLKFSIYITDQSPLSIQHIQERLKDFQYPTEFELVYNVLDAKNIEDYLKTFNITSNDLTVLLGNYFIDSLPKDYLRKNKDEVEIFVLDDTLLHDETSNDQKKIIQWVKEAGRWQFLQDQNNISIKKEALKTLQNFKDLEVFQYSPDFDDILINLGKCSGQKMLVISDAFFNRVVTPTVSCCGGFFMPLSLKSLNESAQHLRFQPFRDESDTFHSGFDTQAFWQGTALNNLPTIQERFRLDYCERNHYEFANLPWVTSYLNKDDLEERVKNTLLPKILGENNSAAEIASLIAPIHFSGDKITNFRAKQCKVIIKEITVLASQYQDTSKIEIVNLLQNPELEKKLLEITLLPTIKLTHSKKINLVKDKGSKLKIAIADKDFLSEWAFKVMNNAVSDLIVIHPYYALSEEKEFIETFRANYKEYIVSIIFGDWMVWMPKKYALFSMLDSYLTKLDVNYVPLNILFTVFLASFYQKSKDDHKRLKNIYRNFCASFGLDFMKSEELKEYSLSVGRMIGVTRREYQEAIANTYALDEEHPFYRL